MSIRSRSTRSGSIRPSVARLAIVAALFTLGACDGDPPADLDAGPSIDAGHDAGTDPDAGPPPDPCPGGCLIGAVCYPDGVTDPADPCRICDAASDATAFVANEGAVCDDGAFCTVGDACSATGECAGAERTCDDGIACNGAETCDETAAACQAGATLCTGGEVCDALGGECVLECTGCLVDGTCYGDGQVDPLDPCRVCDVAATRMAFSDNDGAVCDDGAFCTVDTVCSGGACGGGAARGCDDGVACDGAESCDEAADTCVAGTPTCGADEVCDVGSDTCVSVCTGCVIGGTCYGAGQRNPANDCEVCAPGTAAAAWSPNDGARCDDGLFCTAGDLCSGTTCGGAARDCSNGIACDGAESCDETAGACAPGTPTCAAGTLCDLATDACVTTCSGCVIGGTCYGAGQRDPANPCHVCDVATSSTAWTDNDGARCDDGAFCTDGDVCSGGACAGAARDCTDGVACNGAESCDETADACAPGTSTCASTEVCDVVTDACATTCAGCVIGGVCFADGTRNPSNACETCDPSRSATAWSADDGASCDDGLFCTQGDVCSGGACAGAATAFCDDGVGCNGAETCSESTDRCVAGASTCGAGRVCDPGVDACVTACSGCVVGGICHADGTRNPANACQICDTATSGTAWTTNTGASCDDGLFCTVGDTCSSAATCAGAARDCSDGVSCNGAESCNESADRCDAGTSTCPAGQLCDPSTDACETTCSGCVIGGVCYASGTTNPANGCQLCDTASSTTGWTADAGASCDDGLYCTTGDACSSAAVCEGGASRSCGDGVACNGAETCNDTTDRCDAGTPTCTGEEVCDAATDTCVLTCVGGTTRCGSVCADTDNDPAHCGGCGVACAPWEHCAGGACVTACPAGYADCDGSTANGCEAELATDVDHCGACGDVCGSANATPTCSGGSCSLACDPDWDDCDGDAANGCETDLTSDLLHCNGCGNACSVPTGGTASCDAGRCSLTAPGSAVALWSTPVSATRLAIWADGTLHVTGGTTAHVDPSTGALSSFPGPDNRSSVWIDAGVSQNVNGGSVDRRGYRQDGALDWEWVSLGCCNAHMAMAIDDVGGLAYTSQGGELHRIDLSTGAGSSWIVGGTWGRDSLDGSNAWVAGFDGQVTLHDVTTQALSFTAAIDPGGDAASPRLHPGAVLADGSFAVSTTTGHLARVRTDGTVAWTLTSYGVDTAPVVTGVGLIIVGTSTPLGVSGFAADGSLVGTTPTGDVVQDVLVANGDRIYVWAADGVIISIDLASGATVETYTGMPTSGEMLLRGGVLYVLGDGSLTALPVGASGYDPASPWPVMHHDNQRTSNAGAPLTY